MAKKRKSTKRTFKTSFFNPIIRILQLALSAITKNLHILIIAVILIIIAKGITNILLNADYFTVKEVEMLGMEKRGAVAGPSLRLQLEEGINIFKFNLKECQRKIEEAHPELKDIKVNRVLPDKIVVYFEKRIPVCQVKSSRYYLVSEDAVVLPNPENYARAELPIVSGIYISEKRLPKSRKLDSAVMDRALSLIKQIKQTKFGKKYRVAGIDVYDGFNPIIHLENGTQIKIGRHNFIEKEPALNKVFEDLESKGLRPKSIDLRFDDIIVTPR